MFNLFCFVFSGFAFAFKVVNGNLVRSIMVTNAWTVVLYVLFCHFHIVLKFKTKCSKVFIFGLFIISFSCLTTFSICFFFCFR